MNDAVRRTRLRPSCLSKLPASMGCRLSPFCRLGSIFKSLLPGGAPAENPAVDCAEPKPLLCCRREGIQGHVLRMALLLPRQCEEWHLGAWLASGGRCMPGRTARRRRGFGMCALRNQLCMIVLLFPIWNICSGL